MGEAPAGAEGRVRVHFNNSAAPLGGGSGGALLPLKGTPGKDKGGPGGRWVGIFLFSDFLDCFVFAGMLCFRGTREKLSECNARN